MKNQTDPSQPPPFLEGRNNATQCADVASVLEHANLKSIFQALFDEIDESDVVTFPYKWLRAVGKGKFTGTGAESP